MIDERRKRFGPYLRQMADLMGLRDWTVHVCADGPGDCQLVASANCTYGQKWINIYLSEMFFREDRKSQRSTICHELIHAHTAAMQHYLHKVLTDSEWEAYKVTMEYAVDGIANEWAERLPLPPSRRQTMPPKKGYSKKSKTEKAAGKPKKQATAEDLEMARRTARKAGNPTKVPKKVKKK